MRESIRFMDMILFPVEGIILAGEMPEKMRLTRAPVPLEMRVFFG